ncbi:MAG: toxin-antitoxin system HicB family antitoxin [Acholeplasma sp.]|jgi:predicted RNase H-like HicB family nuclease|nr:toxin-antitoxin system HicB family antitoxin [Acholeplasma sp.]
MNKDYTFRLEKEVFDDHTFEWVASFYEIPGIIGVGDSPEEALKEAISAKDAYIEVCRQNNEPLPQPLSEIKYSGRTTVRMSKRLHQLANETAIEENISLNQLIVDAIGAYVYPKTSKTYKTKPEQGVILINEE